MKKGFLPVLCIVLNGCVTVPKPDAAAPLVPPPGVTGVYHQVSKGETVWRISRMYGLEIDQLLTANGLDRSRPLSEGQRLLIPGRKKPAVPAAGLEDEEFIWPLKGKVLRFYGDYADDAVNNGLDILPAGKNIVVASRSGTVVFHNENFLTLGKTVIVEHPGGFWTVYAGASEVFVKTGDSVARGAAIARVGSPGPGQYLHFEIRKGHLSQNPSFYLPR